MDGVVEIITGRERRRHWSAEQKLKIVGETLVFSWRRQVREGRLVASEMAVFVPVQDARSGTPGCSGPVLSGRMILVGCDPSTVTFGSNRDRTW